MPDPLRTGSILVMGKALDLRQALANVGADLGTGASASSPGPSALGQTTAMDLAAAGSPPPQPLAAANPNPDYGIPFVVQAPLAAAAPTLPEDSINVLGKVLNLRQALASIEQFTIAAREAEQAKAVSVPPESIPSPQGSESPEVQSLFAKLDEDKDGQISALEFDALESLHAQLGLKTSIASSYAAFVEAAAERQLDSEA